MNLPEPKGGRWGEGLTAAKMKECVWLKPLLVAQIEFLEWTGDNHLRHTLPPYTSPYVPLSGVGCFS